MISQKDEIPSFIPKKPEFIILGTMCAINARTIDGKRPEGDFFYYNDNRNHFWKILQYIMEPTTVPVRMKINEKKYFLKKHKIGIQNLVSEIYIPNNAKLDPSDTVLFECQKKNRISFKKISEENRKIIQNSRTFFTCRHKKGIQLLLEGFLKANKMDLSLIENTHYLKSPTRCNPYERSQEWISEMMLN